MSVAASEYCCIQYKSTSSESVDSFAKEYQEYPHKISKHSLELLIYTLSNITSQIPQHSFIYIKKALPVNSHQQRFFDYLFSIY
jgi:hypothetical protein